MGQERLDGGDQGTHMLRARHSNAVRATDLQHQYVSTIVIITGNIIMRIANVTAAQLPGFVHRLPAQPSLAERANSSHQAHACKLAACIRARVHGYVLQGTTAAL